MSTRPPGHQRASGRGPVRWELVGAALAVAGDVLILGRAASGADFDRAVGVVTPAEGDGDRWRSLWNGVAHSPVRIRAGTVTGVLGIGLLTATGLGGAAREIDPGPLRSTTIAAAAAFAVSGVATHVACGSVITVHQQARAGTGRSTRPLTRLLAVSAAGSLLSLATVSAGLTVAAARGRRPVPTRWSWLGPFPPVLVNLLTFGHLPGPFGGYARPASISLGLLAYFSSAPSRPPPAPSAAPRRSGAVLRCIA